MKKKQDDRLKTLMTKHKIKVNIPDDDDDDKENEQDDKGRQRNLGVGNWATAGNENVESEEERRINSGYQRLN